MDSKNICNIHKVESIERTFVINSYPAFLIILLDLDRNIYKHHITQIKKLFSENNINNNYYSIKSIILMPTPLHFTCAVFNIEDEILSLPKGSNIYHDGLDNNGNVLTIENNLDIINENFPYIIILHKN